jgi:hypothetical protein
MTRILGIEFENRIHNILRLLNNNILREKDIKNIYGQNITAIDHLIYSDTFILCIQDKWRCTKESNVSIHHFIYCVEEIHKLENKKCYGLYLSRKGITKIANLSFQKKNNEYKNIQFNSFQNENQDLLIGEFKKFLYTEKLYLYDEDNTAIMLD